MPSGLRNVASTLAPLSWQIRADLFAQLAAMEKAGLPTDQALGLLRMPPRLQTRVTSTRKFLARGVELAMAGKRGGLFTELESNLISAATGAGSPAPTYRRLADYYTQRAMQARAIKSRMTLPALILLTGLVTQGLPALFSGNLTLGRYLFNIFRPLALLAALFFLFTRLFKVHEGPASNTRSMIEKAVISLPLFGKMLIRRNIRDFFESLALMVEAGMPILEALPKALDTIQLSAVKAEFSCIKPGIEHGATLTQTLENITFLNNSQALALINTGEGSGTLPEMLFRFAMLETEAINHFNKQVADWAPRIIYTAVAAWAAYGILSGAGAGPNMPEELR